VLLCAIAYYLLLLSPLVFAGITGVEGGPAAPIGTAGTAATLTGAAVLGFTRSEVVQEAARFLLLSIGNLRSHARHTIFTPLVVGVAAYRTGIFYRRTRVAAEINH